MKRIIAFFRKQRKMKQPQPEARVILVNYLDRTEIMVVS